MRAGGRRSLRADPAWPAGSAVGAAVGEVPSGSGATQRRRKEEAPSLEFRLFGDPDSTPGGGGASAPVTRGGSETRAGSCATRLSRELPPSKTCGPRRPRVVSAYARSWGLGGWRHPEQSEPPVSKARVSEWAGRPWGRPAGVAAPGPHPVGALLGLLGPCHPGDLLSTLE